MADWRATPAEGDVFDPNPVNWLTGKTGTDTAARGAAKAGKSFEQLAQEQWTRAMQGLGQAQGAYQGSNDAWYNAFGGKGPGAYEQWWQQNQGAFQQPRASQDAYNQYQTYMQQPTGASGAYQNAQTALGYSKSNDYYNRFGGQMQQRSQAEQAYNPQDYANPGAMERFTGQAQSNLGGPGAMENWYANHNGEFQAQNRAGAAYGNLTNQMAQKGETEKLHFTNVEDSKNFAQGLAKQQGQGQTNKDAAELGGYYRGADDVSKFAGTQMPGLQNRGLYEQFVAADIAGDNPLLQRGLDQNLARINQEAVRRGGFNSGSAETAIGNELGQFRAADYQNRAQRAQSAQGMELARIGAGQSLAGASAQGKLAQGSALQGLAGQRDAELMGRLGMQMQATQIGGQEQFQNADQRRVLGQAIDAENRARIQGQMGLASSADQSGIAALTGAAGAANMAQTGATSRNTALGNIMNQSQAAELARLQGNMTAAGQSDTGFMNRQKAGFEMSSKADYDELQRSRGLYDMAQSNDYLNQDRYKNLGNFANQLDSTNLQWLTGAGAMAGSAQDAERQRMMDMFNGRFQLDSANAGNISNFYGMGMGAYGQGMGDSFNAMANSAALRGQGQSQTGQFFGNLIARGAGSYFGAPGGGIGGNQGASNYGYTPPGYTPTRW